MRELIAEEELLGAWTVEKYTYNYTYTVGCGGGLVAVEGRGLVPRGEGEVARLWVGPGLPASCRVAQRQGVACEGAESTELRFAIGRCAGGMGDGRFAASAGWERGREGACVALFATASGRWWAWYANVRCAIGGIASRTRSVS